LQPRDTSRLTDLPVYSCAHCRPPAEEPPSTDLAVGLWLTARYGGGSWLGR